jgi:hypothetical protein
VDDLVITVGREVCHFIAIGGLIPGRCYDISALRSIGCCFLLMAAGLTIGWRALSRS